MKKIVKRLALLLCTMSGLGLGFSSCAVHGTGVIDDTTGGGGKGSVAVETDAEIIAKYPNQFMYRYGGKADDQFSATEPYSITDFGKPTDDLMKENSVFRYYPTPVDLAKDTGEFSAVINQGKDEGQQGAGFVQIQDGKVVGWWLVTSHNKIRYWNPNNEVDTGKKSENGSGWDGGSLGAFVTNKDYTVKIKLVESLGKTSDNKGDGGERGFEVKVYDGENVVAEKYCKYGRWMTPNANSKIYFAIGAVKNDSKNNTWKNVTVKIGNGETYTMKKVVNVQDQSSMTVLDSEGKAVSSILLSAGKSVTYTYSAKDKEGSAVVPTVVSDDPAIVSVEKNDTAKTITVTAGTTEGTANVTVTNESGTGKPSVKIKVEVAVPGTVKLDDVEKADFVTAWNELSATGNHTITLTPGTYIIPVGTQLKYEGTGTVTVKGVAGTAAVSEYGANVVIKGNPNTAAQNSRELIYMTGNGTFVLDSVTIENTYSLSSDCQAEVLSSNGSKSKIIANNCTFASHQDTIRTTGKSWFYKCYIKGDVDFLWMEKSGTVALYENCVLHMVGDRKNAAYIAAPRSTYTTDGTIGKGVVVLDSKIKVGEGVEQAYLFRNPWYKDTVNTAALGQCYSQSAFINTTVETGTLKGELAAKPGFGISDNSVVGWKVDSTTMTNDGSTKDSSVGTISAADLAAEYHNRGFILNRLVKINGTSTSYETDDEIWDVTGKIPDAETAKATVNPVANAFDPTSATVTWDFASDLASATIGGATVDTNYYGFNGSKGTISGVVSRDDGTYTNAIKLYADAQTIGGKISFRGHYSAGGNNDTQFNSGAILTIPVTNGAVVIATLKSAAAGIYIENQVTASSDTSVTYTHSGEATGIILYGTNNCYLTEVKVTNLNLTTLSNELKAATATGISRAVKITTSYSEITGGENKTFAAKVYTSYGASASTVTWTTSGDVTNSGAIVTANDISAATSTATVKAAVSDTIFDTVNVTIKKANALSAKIKCFTSGLTGDDALTNALVLSVTGNTSLLTVSPSAVHTFGDTLTGTGSYSKTKLSSNCPMYTSASATFNFSSGTPMSTMSFDIIAGSSNVTLKSISCKSAQSASGGNGALYIKLGDSEPVQLAVASSNIASASSVALNDFIIPANESKTLKIFIAPKENASISKNTATSVKFEYSDLEIVAE